MTIQVIKEVNIGKVLTDNLDSLHKEFSVAVSDEVTGMIARTQRGLDENNKQFKGYSEGYKKYKTKKGRNASPPDLTFTGSMLRAIDYKIVKQTGKFIAEVFFRSSKEEAKARGNLRHRQFFAFSKDQIAKIQQRLKTSFK